jgi:hypothetical protein
MQGELAETKQLLQIEQNRQAQNANEIDNLRRKIQVYGVISMIESGGFNIFSLFIEG